MFSPDEFYHFLELKYSSNVPGRSIWAGAHGSKNLLLEWYGLYPEISLNQDGIRDIFHMTTQGTLILYDQEVFCRDWLDIYRQVLEDRHIWPGYRALTNEEIMLAHWRSPTWPIWCRRPSCSSRWRRWWSSSGSSTRPSR